MINAGTTKKNVAIAIAVVLKNISDLLQFDCYSVLVVKIRFFIILLLFYMLRVLRISSIT